jgi:hypothetical protein
MHNSALTNQLVYAGAQVKDKLYEKCTS